MNKKLQELKVRQAKQLKEKTKSPKKSSKTVIPTYDLKGRDKTPSVTRKKRILSSFIIIVGALLIFIYAPGYFMKDSGSGTQGTVQIVSLDRDAARTINTLLRSDGDSDYDGDGVSNSDESDFGTSPYLIDTDGDHVTDYAEKYVTKTDPIKATTVMIDYQTKQDTEKEKKVSSPYSINNVIMYPSDYESRSYGGVVQLERDKKGLVGAYRFVGFKGYVQFPEDGTAYKYADGIHTPLTKDEKNNVWYIDGDCVVEIYSSSLKEMTRLTLFNKTFYLESNSVFEALTNILPDKGFVTMKQVVEIDTYADTSKNTEATIEKPVYDTSDTTRFKSNTNSLNDLLFVRSTVADGGCVAVSLFSEDDGEYIGIIYGYDAEGNLLVADPDTLESIGKLYIKEQTVKMLDEMGEIVPVSSFEWSGLGLSSGNGYKISFFAATKTSSETNTISTRTDAVSDNTKDADTKSDSKASSTESDTTDNAKDTKSEDTDSAKASEKDSESKSSTTDKETDSTADKTSDATKSQDTKTDTEQKNSETSLESTNKSPKE